MLLNIRRNIKMIKKNNIEEGYFAKHYKLYRNKTRWTLKLNMKSINFQTEALIKFYTTEFKMRQLLQRNLLHVKMIFLKLILILTMTPIVRILLEHIKIGSKKEQLLELNNKVLVDHVQLLQLQLVDKAAWLLEDNTIIEILIFLSNKSLIVHLQHVMAAILKLQCNI